MEEIAVEELAILLGVEKELIFRGFNFLKGLILSIDVNEGEEKQ